MPYSLLTKAIRYATEKHADDYREGDHGLPYITHPVEVCTLLRYVGGVVDEDLLCTAALHDVLEETQTEAGEIESLFGLRIKELVVELTRTEPTAAEIEGMSKKDVWQLRANMLLSEIEKMSSDAQSVKLADRLANVRQSKITRTGDKHERYVRQTKRILEIVPKAINPNLWKAIRAEIE
ncbi:MAG: bifunctional (p)ppGpp synthetase/guanosine-3',5'-bis(diphosphate) 3'-pyrophosphohydrolase [Armatimonadetes bacterium]|nr:bifunctional (p)ppGpp synthetase/guanosine-3',5'-bis(diphosphate) 3'-pyrophosphohydrolase [Armatimonadota bacterium]